MSVELFRPSQGRKRVGLNGYAARAVGVNYATAYWTHNTDAKNVRQLEAIEILRGFLLSQELGYGKKGKFTLTCYGIPLSQYDAKTGKEWTFANMGGLLASRGITLTYDLSRVGKVQSVGVGAGEKPTNKVTVGKVYNANRQAIDKASFLHCVYGSCFVDLPMLSNEQRIACYSLAITGTILPSSWTSWNDYCSVVMTWERSKDSLLPLHESIIALMIDNAADAGDEASYTLWNDRQSRLFAFMDKQGIHRIAFKGSNKRKRQKWELCGPFPLSYTDRLTIHPCEFMPQWDNGSGI